MKDEIRYIVGGAAIGAMAGALVALVHRRSTMSRLPEGEDVSRAVAAPLDRGRVLRLAWAVIAVVRQVLELG